VGLPVKDRLPVPEDAQLCRHVARAHDPPAAASAPVTVVADISHAPRQAITDRAHY
jgi:hypothetical protein